MRVSRPDLDTALSALTPRERQIVAYVAAGRMDGFWEQGLSPWDIGAGILLVREAGGFVSDKAGGQDMFDSGDLVAGNEAIHRALLGTLKKPLPTR